ncbi:hypothetical protein [Agromyces atrinae]|uniref:DUF3828 domain-containing protein n=1 Tax=Agromyces atrinae TaxID=592376 RepID=A0A4Q2MAE4_9MICO|nr:hypothetical protein [Agromyces atrinae]NYD66765.1 hypothetical protein [Agromyces atrinae]RXZ87423.1 hypothetical protein ESP50_05760 [Agromyces atrinae]
MAFWNGRTVRTIGVLAAALTLGACSTADVEAAPTAPALTSEAPSATPSPEPEPEAEPEASSATDGFLAWLDASRLPDADDACARMTPELAEKMIAELNASWGSSVDSCDEMIVATAELYRSLDQSAEVDIAVQEETATDATLFVTYVQSGDCGTVVMTRGSEAWILTELSQECAV